MKIEKQNLQRTNIYHVKYRLEITTHFGGVWQQSVHHRDNSLFLYSSKITVSFQMQFYWVDSYRLKMTFVNFHNSTWPKE